jgi:hypothetical protein
LSLQTSELEMLSRRIREAEERLRRVEEENEDVSSGRPTPPVSPVWARPGTATRQSMDMMERQETYARVYEQGKKDGEYEGRRSITEEGFE